MSSAKKQPENKVEKNKNDLKSEAKKPPQESKHYSGHRKRLREKFLASPSESTTDLELLEMIMYMQNSRQDVKPICKKIMHRFSSIRNLVISFNDKKSELKEFGSATLFVAKLISEINLRVLKEEMEDGIILSNWSSVIKYLQVKYGGISHEKFSILYLNTRYKLLDLVEFGSGTVDESAVYVREVVKTGLDLGATNIVICHNHPSGEVDPSEADIEVTHKIIQAAYTVDIKVIDHFIISKNKHYSFKANAII